MIRKVFTSSSWFQTSHRTFKNFGHKREPDSTFTTLWHGFLTFSFIGLGLSSKKIAKFFEAQELDEGSTQRLERWCENK